MSPKTTPIFSGLTKLFLCLDALSDLPRAFPQTLGSRPPPAWLACLTRPLKHARPAYPCRGAGRQTAPTVPASGSPSSLFGLPPLKFHKPVQMGRPKLLSLEASQSSGSLPLSPIVVAPTSRTYWPTFLATQLDRKHTQKKRGFIHERPFLEGQSSSPLKKLFAKEQECFSAKMAPFF
jgi:hypothetical protein